MVDNAEEIIVKSIKLDNLVLMHCKKGIKLEDLIKIRQYIPIEKKMQIIDAYCDNVIYYDSYGRPGYNSIDKFVKGILMVIDAYTNIKLEGSYEEFDVLEKNCLTEEILALISEYTVFRQYIEARFSDRMKINK